MQQVVPGPQENIQLRTPWSSELHQDVLAWMPFPTTQVIDTSPTHSTHPHGASCLLSTWSLHHHPTHPLTSKQPRKENRVRPTGPSVHLGTLRPGATHRVRDEQPGNLIVWLLCPCSFNSSVLKHFKKQGWMTYYHQYSFHVSLVWTKIPISYSCLDFTKCHLYNGFQCHFMIWASP